MAETTKQRTDRLLGMSHGELVLRAQDLTYQRDELLAALKEAREDVAFWSGHATKRIQQHVGLEERIARYDALIARMEEGK